MASFTTIGCRISLKDAVILFLKRNFISVFLPAGGVSSLVFFTRDLEKKDITKTQIHFASSIYAFVGILSVLIVAFPAFLFALGEGSIGQGEWYALAAILLLSAGMVAFYRSVTRSGLLYRWLIKVYPFALIFLEELKNQKISRKQFLLTVLFSLFIEIAGISHLYIAMAALHYTPSLYAALLGYIISVVFLIVSPFLRGLGAIELGMTFALVRLGYSNVEALAITLLYRFFEFWLPMLAGVMSFLIKVNRLLMRLLPALLLFVLGVINIISVLTPAVTWRLAIVKGLIPSTTILLSNYFVLGTGFFLLVTASFMLKGLRTAWWIALILSAISLVGNLTKAVDYEEAILALGVIFVLFFTRKDYYVKNNPRLRTVGLQTAALSVFAVLIYGTLGFYFLDKKHFLIDFSLTQSVTYTLQNFILIGNSSLVPADSFARDFLYSINISGFLSITFLIYTLIRPYVFRELPSEEVMKRASSILNQYGCSAVDYFKTYSDKLIFAPADIPAFISYRLSGNFAVVLENPVAGSAGTRKECIRRFRQYCGDYGLKPVFYRVSEDNLQIYREFGMKSLFIGQEGIVDLTNFNLEGGAKKSLRNAVNKVIDRGCRSIVYTPPVKDGILQKIKSVSDEWLTETGRNEIVFSQGMFIWEEIKNQTIIAVENREEKIVAFLNLVPDFVSGEATYDLIRKTADAPNGVMAFLLIELFDFLRQQGYKYCNLGFAPMSGINDPHTFPEKSMKFAYGKIRSFAHYKGLREFKEKFFPVWHNKYLVYEHDYDLLQLPGVLNNIIKP
ncbi:MAG: phosphatidylglycerol lysyltransferase domain-containing protein [Bacteroidetes bacterium]|nr:phosphatidylglycerol lysyltransferase domain-containing protein [Bacteroidota bacterium]